jgi:hypothetical protein
MAQGTGGGKPRFIPLIHPFYPRMSRQVQQFTIELLAKGFIGIRCRILLGTPGFFP